MCTYRKTDSYITTSRLPYQILSAVDLLGTLPTNHPILVVVDYYSRHNEYEVLTSTTTDNVINCLKTFISHKNYELPANLIMAHSSNQIYSEIVVKQMGSNI
ncbi:hypothetical protein GOODEAATRI_001591 [Goodea atripinnis]|uniref:Integrase catalytic domain-containing protein n=1 Tax=Goodea atripinnis TaxID=208336 RepID=A0ABV0PUJ0_9TELE